MKIRLCSRWFRFLLTASGLCLEISMNIRCHVAMMGMMQLIDIDIDIVVAVAVAVAVADAVVFDCKNVFILIAICVMTFIVIVFFSCVQ